MFIVGLIQRQDFRLCGTKQKTVCVLFDIVRHCYAEDSERGSWVLKLKNMKDVMINCLMSPVANTRLGIDPCPKITAKGY
jgi:hypothetical protein